LIIHLGVALPFRAAKHCPLVIPKSSSFGCSPPTIATSPLGLRINHRAASALGERPSSGCRVYAAVFLRHAVRKNEQKTPGVAQDCRLFGGLMCWFAGPSTVTRVLPWRSMCGEFSRFAERSKFVEFKNRDANPPPREPLALPTFGACEIGTKFSSAMIPTLKGGPPRPSLS